MADAFYGINGTIIAYGQVKHEFLFLVCFAPLLILY